ncbi:MAG: glutathione S-transferase family protein [Rhizobiaceae bacterium]
MAIILHELVGADPARPFSPHCWKAQLALAHKGLEFRTVPARFLDVPTVEGGVSKTVPVIRDGDRVVADSFAIAEYLEDAYPGRPTLFGGQGGRATARFVERWSQLTIHAYVGGAALMDLLAIQDAENAVYFRGTRELRFGASLEDVAAGRDAGLKAFRASLEPLRSMLSFQPFVGGQGPLFPDYIVAGAFQWLRVVSTYGWLADGDPVAEWFERCLDLHGGLMRRVPPAA